MYAYHGTGLHNAQRIVKDSDWSHASISNVLGDGIYFVFNNDRQLAARQAYDYHLGRVDFIGSEPEGLRVVEALIIPPVPGSLLDFDDPINKKLLLSVIDFFKQQSQYKQKNDDQLSNVAVNWLCEYMLSRYSRLILAIKQTLRMPNSYVIKHISIEDVTYFCVTGRELIHSAEILKFAGRVQNA